jgi:DnaK suppressor protein
MAGSFVRLVRRSAIGFSSGGIQRRHTVKVPAKKAKMPAKALAKTAAKSSAKPPNKSAVKTKTAPKPPAKAVKAVKSAKVIKTGKSVKATKPSAKKTVKPVAVKKPAAKAKPVAVKAKVAAKPVVKPGLKTNAKKGVKPSSKLVKPVVKPSVKPTAKPIVKPAEKKAAKKAVKAVKPLPEKAIKKPVKTGAPVVAPATVIAPRPVEKSMLIPAPPALKPGRRSSARALAHMPPPAPMVPTHSPDAAKASYSTITERVIAPPPHVAAKKDPKLANNWKSKTAEELSDEEVKAMPDAEYMNDKQLAFFRHKLSILKQDIHNSAGETTEHLREDTVVVPDPADRATIEEEHALELRTRDRERKLLKKIEQSIARIDSGDYGYCDETGEPIGVGRLIARPTANLSLEAQQRRELKQKMFGD